MSALLNENKASKFFDKLLRYVLVGLSSFSLATFTTAAVSAYQYTYSGNTITGTYTNYHVFEPEPYVTTEDFTAAVFISFTSPTLLTGPIDLSDIGSFMMGGETTPSYFGNNSFKGNWVYPYPYPGTVAYHSYGEFAINAVDANGLPTDWTIKMFGDAGYTRHTYSNFESSPGLDKIYGYSEYGYEWSGEIAMDPGQWNVTSVVPEPETYAMLLAGLGLIGFVYHRRRSMH
jgi:hypothetical protein